MTSKLNRGSMVFVESKYKGQNIIGAEIGVMAGVHATNLLEHMPGLEHLYLIDPYLVASPVDFKQIAYEAVSPFQDRVTWIYKKFHTCRKKDIPQQLDFVYIDGDHSYKGVKSDLNKAAKVVKEGGVIGGHDFQMAEVEKAVREYCKKNDRLLETWGGEWWFINAPMVDASFNH